MTMSTFLGIVSLIVPVSFIIYAFRQGMKLKSPEAGGGSGDHGHSPDH